MSIVTGLIERWQGLEQRSKLWLGYGCIVLLVIALAGSMLAERIARIEQKRVAREKVLKELLRLKGEYRKARLSADQMSGRMATVRPDDTPSKLLEEIGIKGKGLRITPLKTEERDGMLEDAAEVRIDGLTLNEVVNLLFRLEKGERPIVLKKTNLKMRFDDPSRCDLIVVFALLKSAVGQGK